MRFAHESVLLKKRGGVVTEKGGMKKEGALLDKLDEQKNYHLFGHAEKERGKKEAISTRKTVD